jgi:tetratricopeptide (TPR) repeat protein
MNIFRILRLGIRVAEWATPRVQEWHQQKHLNRTEGVRHFDARNYAEAERHLTAALEEKHSNLHRVEILSKLATSQVRLNKLDAAAGNARAAADLARMSGIKEVQWQAVESLVGIQEAQGNLRGAVESLRAMEEVEQSSQTPDLERLIKASRQRGKLLLRTGQRGEALKAIDESVQTAEKHWGAEHAETANSLCELGSFHSQAGDYQKALPYLERAVSIYRKTTGFDSPEASSGLQNLAAALDESGNVDRAIAEYERFLVVQDRLVGMKGADAAQAQVRLSALYIQAGRSSAARELLTLAIGTLTRTPGIILKDALEIMAVAEDQSGRPQEAEQWRKKAAAVVIPQPTPAAV